MNAPSYPFQNWVHWTPPVVVGATSFLFARQHEAPEVAFVIALGALLLTEHVLSEWQSANP